MKLLVAINIDESAEAVIAQAVAWADKLGGTIDLAYIDEYVYDGALISDPSVRQLVVQEWERIHEAHRKRTEALRETLPELVRGDVHYRAGSAWREIVNLAASYDAVLVATHGRTGLGHLFLGSVAEKVVRYASCPVIVLRLPPKED